MINVGDKFEIRLPFATPVTIRVTRVSKLLGMVYAKVIADELNGVYIGNAVNYTINWLETSPRATRV